MINIKYLLESTFVIGVLGSIIGNIASYALTHVYRLIKKKILYYKSFHRMMDDIEFDILWSDVSDRSIILTRIIISFVFYSTFFLFGFIALIAISISPDIKNNTYIKEFAFLIGLLTGISSYKLGYYYGFIKEISKLCMAKFVHEKGEKKYLENVVKNQINKKDNHDGA